MAKILVFWVVLCCVAFANGALRALVYGAVLGEPWSHHVSVGMGILLISTTVWLLTRRWPFASRRQAAQAGLTWLLLTEVFEVTMVVGVMKKPWNEFLHMHQLFQGQLWPIFLIALALVPALLYRWQHQRSGLPLAPEDAATPFAHETLEVKGKRLFFAIYGLLLFHAVLLFASAGTWRWTAAWIFMGIEVTFYSIEVILIVLTNPAVLNARAKKHEGSEPFERTILWTHIVLVSLLFLVAGLDSGRWQWSVMSPALSTLGLFLLLGGACLSTWALLVNPFFEPTVRIQTDRQHRVIQNGPYGYLRHPGYAGAISLLVGNTLILGSWLAFGVAILCAINLIRRTYLEDRTLQEKLPGYAAYTHLVRYRLFPLIW